MPIPLSNAWITKEDEEAVLAVLRSGRLALGPELAAFERDIAGIAGVREAVACSSGTAALHMILSAMGVGEGDFVLTTPFSFVASSNAVLMVGAVPVFVDIDPASFCPSPEALRAAIARVRAGEMRLPNGMRVEPHRLKAMLLVDVFGMPAPWHEYEEIARSEGLELVEDSCEALGARAFGKACGSFGRAGCFAFYPNKQITTGEGGIVVTDDEKIAAMCRSLANQGRGADGAWLAHVRLGYNYRMPDLCAALGRSQLARLDEILRMRNAAADRYAALLRPLPVEAPTAPDFCEVPSWFVYVIRLSRGTERGRVLAELKRRGIESKPYFTPIPLQPFYVELFGYAQGHFPVLDDVCSRVLALPFHSKIAPEEQEEVVAALQEALSVAVR